MRPIVCSTKKQPRKTRGCFLCCNTASGMDCMQFLCYLGAGSYRVVSIPQAVWIACNADEPNVHLHGCGVSIPQAVWIACNNSVDVTFTIEDKVSIPQAVWIACNMLVMLVSISPSTFQYRKRYGLHAIISLYCSSVTRFRFNTASGMDCMQSIRSAPPKGDMLRFNTASGMDCMQFMKKIIPVLKGDSFNTASGMDCMQF